MALTINSTGNAFLEIDGVILNTVVALINGAKSSLRDADVKDLVDVKLKKLKQILEEPSLYRSEPADVLGKLAGLARVPVASGKIHSAEAKAACAEKGVHLLESDGIGYRCTLHKTLPPALPPRSEVVIPVPQQKRGQ